jgi:hypothetical protein
MVIHCFGDSHVSVFSGQDKISDGYPGSIDILPNFRTYRLGAHLAHSIGTPGHSAFNTFFDVLGKVPTEDAVLLSFGEVDCRVHVVTQSVAQNKTIPEVISEVAQRYARTVELVRERNSKVIIWCPVPTSTYYDPSAHIQEINPYPHIGTTEQRNLATKVFEGALRSYFSNTDIIVLSIFNKIVNQLLITDGGYYMDGVHLSQKAMPLILSELGSEIKNKWGVVFNADN